MALIARVFGVSLMTSALVTGLGLALFASISREAMRPSVCILVGFFPACVGGVIGAIAGAAREVVSAQRKNAPDWADSKS